MATAEAARPAAPAGFGLDHVVVFPFMAKGHTIPLLHLASALAARHGDGGGGGLRVTVLTTPGNLAFARRRAMPLESVIDVSDIDAVLQRAAEADQLAEAASVSSDSDLVIDL